MHLDTYSNLNIATQRLESMSWAHTACCWSKRRWELSNVRFPRWMWDLRRESIRPFLFLKPSARIDLATTHSRMSRIANSRNTTNPTVHRSCRYLRTTKAPIRRSHLCKISWNDALCWSNPVWTSQETRRNMVISRNTHTSSRTKSRNRRKPHLQWRRHPVVWILSLLKRCEMRTKITRTFLKDVIECPWMFPIISPTLDDSVISTHPFEVSQHDCTTDEMITWRVIEKKILRLSIFFFKNLLSVSVSLQFC